MIAEGGTMRHSGSKRDPKFEEPITAFTASAVAECSTQSAPSSHWAEVRHQRFLDGVPVGVIDWTLDGAIRDANDCFLRMVGYSREDLCAGRIRWTELTPEEFQRRDQEAIAELRAKGMNEPYEKAFLRKDGSRVPILLSCVTLDPGKCEAGTAFVLDLSELKQAERALRESQQRLRFHVENTSLALIEWDASFVITRWSTAAERLFGWTAEEAVGKLPDELHLVHDEDQSIACEVMARLTNGTTRGIVSPNRNYAKDGRVMHCTWYNSVLLDEYGQISSVMSLVEDRTASVEAEEALRQAKQLAESANAAKERFLASVSHEVRTPLTAIAGFSELLIQPGISAEELGRYLRVVRHNACTLVKLVDQLLDLSKIEAGKMDVELAEHALRSIVDDVVSATILEAKHKHLGLDVEYQYPLPGMIRTDGLRLWQILVNLVGNAIKFTERGGVRIGVALDAAEPDGKRRLRFTVSDTGTGIRPEHQSHLFEPFWQDDGRARRGHRGVGLGLPIAAKIAELLGTRIELVSPSGAGAAFTFSLDAGPWEVCRMQWAAPRDSGDEPDSADAAAEKLTGRILLADDAPDTVELLRIHLQGAGLQVDAAADGLAAVRDALAAASAGRPYDLILMDLQMPELDGYQAVRLLRASAWRGSIVALTAHATREDQRRCLESGFDGYLAKPVTRADLLAMVRRCLAAGASTVSQATAGTQPDATSARELASGVALAPRFPAGTQPDATSTRELASGVALAPRFPAGTQPDATSARELASGVALAPRFPAGTQPDATSTRELASGVALAPRFPAGTQPDATSARELASGVALAPRFPAGTQPDATSARELASGVALAPRFPAGTQPDATSARELASGVALAPRFPAGTQPDATSTREPGEVLIGRTSDIQQAPLETLFANQLPARLARLEQGLRERDRTSLAQTAHQLVGAAGQFGFLEIAATAAKLEQGVRAGAHAEELADLVEAVRDAARAIPGPFESAQVPRATAQLVRHRVLLAEDDQLVRTALRTLVDRIPGFQVVAEAASGREVLGLVEKDRPDVVLMDIAMPELDGLSAAEQIAACHSPTKVVIVSGRVCEETVFQAVRAGAVGYLSKSVSAAEFEQALKSVVEGGTFFCSQATQYLVAHTVEDHRSRAHRSKHLTPRQLEVLTRIAEGDSTKMIARKLGITIKTAEHHRANLMRQLNIHDTASLVRWAVKTGLVEPNG
jgi:PAS domain S-box-containing protein